MILCMYFYLEAVRPFDWATLLYKWKKECNIKSMGQIFTIGSVDFSPTKWLVYAFTDFRAI